MNQGINVTEVRVSDLEDCLRREKKEQGEGSQGIESFL